MNKKSIAMVALTLSLGVTASGFAASALSLPGYFGSINNNTSYVIECSQVIGGYCANNPMPANGYIQMLPDPGSKMIRGHLMVFQKNVPGKYLDNIMFSYSEGSSGNWSFKTKGLYNAVTVTPVMPDTLLLNQKMQSTTKQSMQ